MQSLQKQDADILKAKTAEHMGKSKKDKLKLIANIDTLIDLKQPETDENAFEEYAEYEEQPEPYIPTIFDILDRPRNLPDPIDLTLEHIEEIEHKLGLIKLCWPKLGEDVAFEGRTNYPKSYLENNTKERCLLLYAENFRRQFCVQYPHRRPLLLACENECGMQVHVCLVVIKLILI